MGLIDLAIDTILEILALLDDPRDCFSLICTSSRFLALKMPRYNKFFYLKYIEIHSINEYEFIIEHNADFQSIYDLTLEDYPEMMSYQRNYHISPDTTALQYQTDDPFLQFHFLKSLQPEWYMQKLKNPVDLSVETGAHSKAETLIEAWNLYLNELNNKKRAEKDVYSSDYECEDFVGDVSPYDPKIRYYDEFLNEALFVYETKIRRRLIKEMKWRRSKMTLSQRCNCSEFSHLLGIISKYEEATFQPQPNSVLEPGAEEKPFEIWSGSDVESNDYVCDDYDEERIHENLREETKSIEEAYFNNNRFDFDSSHTQKKRKNEIANEVDQKWEWLSTISKGYRDVFMQCLGGISLSHYPHLHCYDYYFLKNLKDNFDNNGENALEEQDHEELILSAIAQLKGANQLYDSIYGNECGLFHDPIQDSNINNKVQLQNESQDLFDRQKKPSLNPNQNTTSPSENYRYPGLIVQSTLCALYKLKQSELHQLKKVCSKFFPHSAARFFNDLKTVHASPNYPPAHGFYDVEPEKNLRPHIEHQEIWDFFVVENEIEEYRTDENAHEWNLHQGMHALARRAGVSAMQPETCHYMDSILRSKISEYLKNIVELGVNGEVTIEDLTKAIYTPTSMPYGYFEKSTVFDSTYQEHIEDCSLSESEENENNENDQNENENNENENNENENNENENNENDQNENEIIKEDCQTIFEISLEEKAELQQELRELKASTDDSCPQEEKPDSYLGDPFLKSLVSTYKNANLVPTLVNEQEEELSESDDSYSGESTGESSGSSVYCSYSSTEPQDPEDATFKEYQKIKKETNDFFLLNKKQEDHIAFQRFFRVQNELTSEIEIEDENNENEDDNNEIEDDNNEIEDDNNENENNEDKNNKKIELKNSFIVNDTVIFYVLRRDTEQKKWREFLQYVRGFSIFSLIICSLKLVEKKDLLEFFDLIDLGYVQVDHLEFNDLSFDKEQWQVFCSCVARVCVKIRSLSILGCKRFPVQMLHQKLEPIKNFGRLKSLSLRCETSWLEYEDEQLKGEVLKEFCEYKAFQLFVQNAKLENFDFKPAPKENEQRKWGEYCIFKSTFEDYL